MPELIDNIYIYTSNHRSLYLNPEAPDWITIEEKYKPILDLFNGKNDDIFIFEYINQFFNNEKDILIPQIKSLLMDSKIFLDNKSQNIHKDNIGNTIPKYVYLTLTDECNLNCIYCYATERRKHQNTNLDVWKKYVSDIIDFSGKPIFTFTGGEPLIIPYIFDLATYIKERGCECILLTNGTLINTNECANKIAELFGLIKISLDTNNEKISRELRGSGVVDKVRRAFNLLSNKNCNVQILATVTAKTNNDLNDFYEMFNHQVHFQPLYQSIGRARNKKNLSITGEQYYNALSSAGIFSFKNILEYRNNPCKRCSMAIEELSIDSDGNVYPCHILHSEKFVCGNLNKDKIAEIYKNSVILNELRTVNVDTIPKCRECVFRNICGGACRARIDFNRYSIKDNDDFCSFEKKAILHALLYSYG